MANPMGKWKGQISTAKVENPYVFNDFGCVSQEAADSYGQYMKKYKNVEPDNFRRPTGNKINALQNKNNLKNKRLIRKQKKVVSQEFVSDDEDEDDVGLPKKHEPTGDNRKPQVIKVKVGKPAKANVAQSGQNSKASPRKQENSICKRPRIRPPMTYEELLKLAERNQRESLMAKLNRTQPERPMTKKEKLSYFAKTKEDNNRKQFLVRT